MKQQSRLLLTLMQGAGIGAVALAGGSLLSTDALAGVSDTRHNLGASGTVLGANQTTNTADVCVFCHTPHSSNSATGAPPLWNKNLPSSTYTMYSNSGSSTLDAANSSGSLAAGSTSLACLSCHDGTQAIDNVINAPGSGGYNSDGGGANGVAFNWTSSATLDTDGKISNQATNLGTDLSNDHPIGVAYCGGVATGAYGDGGTAGCIDGDFKNIRKVGSGSSAQYWVDVTGGTGAREKTDMYLYTRQFGGSFNGDGYGPSVECGSCHDPHVVAKETNQVAFLRVSQSSSGLCLSCHAK